MVALWLVRYKALLLLVCHLIVINNLVESCSRDEQQMHGVLLCRQCGHDIVTGDNFIKVGSKLALARRNATVLGNRVLVQIFKNPAGEHFDVIAADEADMNTVGDAHSEASWFPGYSWTIGVCPKCGSHLGWYFTPNGGDEAHPFNALVLDYLLSDDFSDSLTVVPKPKTTFT